jgi:hypothetical protein
LRDDASRTTPRVEQGERFHEENHGVREREECPQAQELMSDPGSCAIPMMANPIMDAMMIEK